MNISDYMYTYQNSSVTENGACGYNTTSHALLDLNFMVSSLRNHDEDFIVKEYIKAYYESPKYAVKWLFFLRDIREGLGERRTFRICMKYLAESQVAVAKAVMELMPTYGRYDDLLILLETELCDDVVALVKQQLEQDLSAMKEGKGISLLAKWLPSINTSSHKTRQTARFLAKKLQMSEKEYRKMLSALRTYGNVVEVQMSASKWDAIDYQKVPSKANMIYDAAFMIHDKKRRCEYLTNVFKGDAKLNRQGIMPYEIVHRFLSRDFLGLYLKDDFFAELMWRNIIEQGFENTWGFEDCIVVADGSGSMYTDASGSTSVMAIEICTSLAICFAEQLKGVFHNKAITFSARPQFIDLEKGQNLKEKLEIMLAHSEVANTNIEAVFDLILDMAISNEVPSEELPKQLLIISDMEFDSAVSDESVTDCDRQRTGVVPKLFETIEKRYCQAGYRIPRLIFWNVCGRSNTIPKVNNDEGICLLSGFSTNALKIASNTKSKDAYEALIQILDGARYEAVEQAIVKCRH